MGVKISELPNNSLPYTGSEEIPLIQSGETRAGTLSSFVNYLSGDLLADTELAALSGNWQNTYTSYSTNSATFVTYTGATQDVDLGSNNLTTTGYVSAGTAFAESLTANNFTALSATINVVDITEYELSGFSVSGAVAVNGNLDLEGNTTLNGDLTVDTNTLHVDSSNNRVGIGTTTPLSALDVNGPVKITGDTDTNSNAALAVYASDGTSRFEIRDNGRWIVLNSSGTQRASYQPSSYGGAGLLNLGSGRLWCNNYSVNSGAISFGTGGSNTSDITFTANGATAFKIEGTTGDLEIGSSNSLTYADVSGGWDGSSLSGNQTFKDNVTVEGTTTLTDDLTVDTNTLHVDASTNRVGVGTASPSYAFDQAGSAALGSGTLYVDSSNNRVGIGASSPSYALDQQGDASIGSGTLHVDSASNVVGIGTTSPSYALDIPFGDINVGGFINVGSDVTITSNLYCSSFYDAGASGQWGSESSGDFTFNGGVNISGQAEATNQAASTDNSLMTRSLVDTDRWLNTARLWSPLVIPTFTKTGTGSVSQTSAGDAWISLQSGTSNSGYGKAVIGRGLNNAPGFAGNGIYFSKPIGLSCNIAKFAANDESNRIRIIIGTGTGAPAAAGSDPISDDGFGVELKRTSTHTQWRVFAHNGTTLTATAFANLYSSSKLNPVTLAIYSNGSGTVTAYYGNFGADSFSTISTTGGPTTTGASATSRAAIEVANSSSGTATSKANVYSCKFYTPDN